MPGALILERPDGRPDELAATDLANLLRQAGGRLKLVTLSACHSAAASIDQTLAWLGIAPSAVAAREASSDLVSPEAAKAAPGVARALTEAVGCAVVGMRYPVEDEFAVQLADGLYDRLFRQKQPLPQAIRLTMDAIVGEAGSTPPPGALSAAAPALFGPKAADLVLVPPRGAGLQSDTRLAYVRHHHPESEYFVGRVAAMTKASAALAPESDKSGVLFHGMAGAGKTSCMAELIYHHAATPRFQSFVWYSAPGQGKDIALALRDFALELERRLPELELAMLHVIDCEDEFRDWLPRLKEALENNAILIALDNLESLLTEAGRWRDPRWGLLMEALLTLSPGGFSRTLLTSRILPAGLPDTTEVITVHALPRDEAILLVRELPNLRDLMDGTAPGVTQEQGRQLVRRVLRLVQGHPKLIELAEALAKEPANLRAHLDQADAAQDKGDGELDAFFQEGETRHDATDFIASLRAWTRGIASALPGDARTFFHFLSCLEEDDREEWILKAVWPALWRQLGRPEPVPDIAAVLASVEAAGLVEKHAAGAGGAFELAIHPGVAEAGRAEAGGDFQAVIDEVLAGIWQAFMTINLEDHGKNPTAGSLIVRAGLAAVPLPQLGRAEWGAVVAMLEQAHAIDHAPATTAAVLPLARRLAATTAGTEVELISRRFLARAMLAAGQMKEAEELLRAVTAQAAERGDFRLATVASGDLATLLWQTGRLEAALHLAGQKSDYTRRAGLGPWSQLRDEEVSLQALTALGRHEEVLRRLAKLRQEMRTLPDQPGPNDPPLIATWDVRETLLDIGCRAAIAREEWQQALDLNAEVQRSMGKRGAPPFEWARTRFNDYTPLWRLGRLREALELLLRCRTVFEQQNAVNELAGIFMGLPLWNSS